MSLIKKFSKALTVVAATGALFAGDALATEGYFQNGLGARHKALAGAGAADGKDATILTVNPAGLVGVGRQFNGSVTLFMPFREYSATAPGAGEFIAGGGTFKSRRNFFPVPNIAYSHPLDDTSAIGFSVSGNGGMNTSYPNIANGNCAAPPFPATSGAFCGGKAGVDLTQMLISVGYAQKLGKYVSVGVSPVFALQRFKARGIGAFGGASVSPGNLSNRGYDYNFGAGVRLGFQVNLTDYIRVGAAYQSRIFSSRFKKYSGLFADRGSFDIPANLQFGVAFDLTPDLTVMVDYRHIFYADVNAIGNLNNTAGGVLLGQGNGSGFGWKDTDTIKIGLEYNASEALTLRAGYSYNTNPVRSSQVAFNILAPAVVQHHISGGGSYKLNQNSQIDFAATFVPSAKTTGFIGAAGQVGTIKMHQVELTAGYTYHFN